MIHYILITFSTLDAALPQLQNLCAIFEGGNAVRNNEQSKVIAEDFDGLHDGLFGFIVQRASGFDNLVGLGFLDDAREVLHLHKALVDEGVEAVVQAAHAHAELVSQLALGEVGVSCKMRMIRKWVSSWILV